MSQSGLRAVHTARPCSTSRWQKSFDFSGGRTARSAFSMRTGSLSLSTRPSRFESRMQCVSVTMAGFPKTSPAENEIGAFAPHAGERQEIVHIVRHLAAVDLRDALRLPDEIARLAMVKAAGADELFDLADVRRRHGLHGREAREERGRDEIHAPARAAARRPVR